jgi:hypothetical protein
MRKEIVRLVEDGKYVKVMDERKPLAQFVNSVTVVN